MWEVCFQALTLPMNYYMYIVTGSQLFFVIENHSHMKLFTLAIVIIPYGFLAAFGWEAPTEKNIVIWSCETTTWLHVMVLSFSSVTTSWTFFIYSCVMIVQWYVISQYNIFILT